MLCVATSCMAMLVSLQRRAMYQSVSDSRSWSSIVCSCVSFNLPDAKARESKAPILPASSCNPKTGKFIRSRSFRKESGVLTARLSYSSNVFILFFRWRCAHRAAGTLSSLPVREPRPPMRWPWRLANPASPGKSGTTIRNRQDLSPLQEWG